LPKLPVIDAKQAEQLLFNSGFIFVRGKGSHRIYEKGKIRIVIPFHSGKSLHPKIVKELLEIIK
jgi:predicted RNA binding protein YcfA (HicA-like mRNA interferase family)